MQKNKKIYTLEKYDQLSQHEKNIHNKAFATNSHWNAEPLCRFLSFNLVAHDPDMFGSWANKRDFVFFEDLSKAGIFRKKPVAGVDGIGAGDFARRHERRNVEVAVAGSRWTDAYAFVS